MQGARGALDLYDPLNLSVNLLWYKQSGITGADTDPVSTWADEGNLVGGGLDFTQASTLRPTVNATGAPNGGKSILFDGINHWLTTGTDASVAADMHVFMVIKQVSWTNLDRIMDGRTGSFNIRQYNAVPPQVQIDFVAANNDATVGSWFLWEIQMDNESAPNVDAWFQVGNGTATTGTMSWAGTPPNGLRLGTDAFGGAKSNIEVCELMVFCGGLLTASERTATRNYFSNTFSVTV